MNNGRNQEQIVQAHRLHVIHPIPEHYVLAGSRYCSLFQYLAPTAFPALLPSCLA